MLVGAGHHPLSVTIKARRGARKKAATEKGPPITLKKQKIGHEFHEFSSRGRPAATGFVRMAITTLNSWNSWQVFQCYPRAFFRGGFWGNTLLAHSVDSNGRNY
jgi:hypothetical protein